MLKGRQVYIWTDASARAHTHKHTHTNTQRDTEKSVLGFNKGVIDFKIKLLANWYKSFRIST